MDYDVNLPQSLKRDTGIEFFTCRIRLHNVCLFGLHSQSLLHAPVAWVKKFGIHQKGYPYKKNSLNANTPAKEHLNENRRAQMKKWRKDG
jgi:hypothetical protein